MNNLFLFLLDMPPAVKGQVRPNAEGDYYIFLNAIYNTQQLRETYNHEVRHLLLGHHTIENAPVEELEKAANCKTSLLAQIREAEENGLPLETALLVQRGKGEPYTGPNGAGAAVTAQRPGTCVTMKNTTQKHANVIPAPDKSGEEMTHKSAWWGARLKMQARSVLTNLWY